MKNLSIYCLNILLLSLLVSCGAPKKSQVNLSLTLGGLTSLGSFQDGGAMFYGSSDTGKSIAVRLDTLPGDQLNFDLSNGTWDFHAIAWDGDHDQNTTGTNVPLTGKVRCAKFVGQQLAGSPVTVSLNLSNTNCADPVFSTNRNDNAGAISFFEQKFKTCRNHTLMNANSDYADSQCDYLASTGGGAGFYSSFQILLVPYDALDGAKIENYANAIKGPCYRLTSNTDSELTIADIDSNPVKMNIPGGSNSTKFPFHTVARGYFGSEACSDADVKGFFDTDLPLGADAGHSDFSPHDYGTNPNIGTMNFIATPENQVCNYSFTAFSGTSFASGSANSMWNGICGVDNLQNIGGVDGANFSANKAKSYVLLDSVNFYESWSGAGGTQPLGDDFNIIGDPITDGGISVAYSGIFDGNNHSIIGMKINLETPTYNAWAVREAGFIRNLSGKVKDLTFLFADVEGKTKGAGAHETFGIVAGKSSGIIENVKVIDSEVKAIRIVGGLVGELTSASGDIIGSHLIDSEVEGVYQLGGLVGVMSTSSSVTESSFDGNIDPKHERGHCSNDSGEDESNCGATWIYPSILGGIVGQVTGTGTTISKSKVQGLVKGVHKIGGIVGEIFTAMTLSITDSYSLATVVSTSMGNAFGGDPDNILIGGIAGAVDGTLNLATSFHTMGPIVKQYSTTFSGDVGLQGGGGGTFNPTNSYSTAHNGSPITYADLRNSVSVSMSSFGVNWNFDDDTLDFPRLAWEDVRPCAGTFGSTLSVGTGTESDPYQICNKLQLLDIQNYTAANTYFKLMRPIDMEGQFYISESAISGDFNGVLLGNDFFISNFALTPSPATVPVGLFSLIGASGIVKDLTIIPNKQLLSIHATHMIGVLAGKNLGIIDRVHVHADVVGGDGGAGGIVGLNKGMIVGSTATGHVKGTKYFGGIAGINSGGGILYSQGKVIVEPGAVQTSYMGGLVGKNIPDAGISFYNELTGTTESYNGRIEQSNAGGMILMQDSSLNPYLTTQAGGIAGFNSGTISNVSLDNINFTFPFMMYTLKNILHSTTDKNSYLTSDGFISYVGTDFESYLVGDYLVRINGINYPVRGMNSSIADLAVNDGGGNAELLPLTSFGFCVGENGAGGVIKNVNCSSYRADNLFGASHNNYSPYFGELVGKNSGTDSDIYDNVTVGIFNYGGANEYAFDPSLGTRNYGYYDDSGAGILGQVTFLGPITSVATTFLSTPSDYSAGLTVMDPIIYSHFQDYVAAVPTASMISISNDFSQVAVGNLYSIDAAITKLSLYDVSYWDISTSEDDGKIWTYDTGHESARLSAIWDYKDGIGREQMYFAKMLMFDN